MHFSITYTFEDWWAASKLNFRRQKLSLIWWFVVVIIGILVVSLVANMKIFSLRSPWLIFYVLFFINLLLLPIFFKLTLRKRLKQMEDAQPFEFTVDATGWRLKTSKSDSTFGWNAFKKYYVGKGVIALCQLDRVINTVIPQSCLTNQQWEELLALATEKLGRPR